MESGRGDSNGELYNKIYIVIWSDNKGLYNRDVMINKLDGGCLCKSAVDLDLIRRAQVDYRVFSRDFEPSVESSLKKEGFPESLKFSYCWHL